MTNLNTDLPYADFPEQVGVKPDCIKKFADEAKKNNLEFHSLIVMRYGKIACEWYNEPYNADMKAAMYSVSKSWTATAMGIAEAEGLLSLNDKVMSYFPEYKAKKNGNGLEMMTIKHLLTMTAGKNISYLMDRAKVDWVQYFIDSPWTNKPGKGYLYVNENLYICLRILRKVTGLTATEYLKPRLLDPLGIEDFFWEKAPDGTECGGWGLFIRPRDLAKLATCYLQGGVYNGKQILSEKWVKEATRNQLGNIKMTSPDRDRCSGYGYNLWMNADKPYGYRMDGMMSNFAINWPELNATVVCTASIPSETAAIQCLWKVFPDAFSIEKKSKPTQEYIHVKSTIFRPLKSVRSPMEKQINGANIFINKSPILTTFNVGVSMLPLVTTFMMYDRAGHINDIKFNFKENELELSWDEGVDCSQSNTIPVGLDGEYREGVMHLGGIDFKVLSNAEWVNPSTLRLYVRAYETVSFRIFEFNFKDNGIVYITPNSTPSTKELVGFASNFFEEFIKPKAIIKPAQLAIHAIPPIIEPTMIGRLYK